MGSAKGWFLSVGRQGTDSPGAAARVLAASFVWISGHDGYLLLSVPDKAGHIPRVVGYDDEMFSCCVLCIASCSLTRVGRQPVHLHVLFCESKNMFRSYYTTVFAYMCRFMVKLGEIGGILMLGRWRGEDGQRTMDDG